MTAAAKLDAVKPLVDEWIRSRGTSMSGDAYGAALELAAHVATRIAANGAKPKTPIEFVGIAEMLAAGEGHWQPCSGCYDTEDGHPTHLYVHSAALNCSLGNGCSECGGLGAVWLNYADLPTAEDLADLEDAAPVADSAMAKDAEAFRLMAKHRLLVGVHLDESWAQSYGTPEGEWITIKEKNGDDACAAARRAIDRAVAAIAASAENGDKA